MHVQDLAFGVLLEEARGSSSLDVKLSTADSAALGDHHGGIHLGQEVFLQSS